MKLNHKNFGVISTLIENNNLKSSKLHQNTTSNKIPGVSLVPQPSLMNAANIQKNTDCNNQQIVFENIDATEVIVPRNNTGKGSRSRKKKRSRAKVNGKITSSNPM